MDLYRHDWLDAETPSTQPYLLNTLLEFVKFSHVFLDLDGQMFASRADLNLDDSAVVFGPVAMLTSGVLDMVLCDMGRPTGLNRSVLPNASGYE